MLTKLLTGKIAHLVSTSLPPVNYQRLTENIELKKVKRALGFCGINVNQVDRLGHYVVGKYKDSKKRDLF